MKRLFDIADEIVGILQTDVKADQSVTVNPRVRRFRQIQCDYQTGDASPTVTHAKKL